MFVVHLQLTGFRLFQKTSLEFGPHVNFIYGNNAQGKTSLLEALRLLSTSRSFVTSRTREMVTFGSDHFFIHAELRCRTIPLDLRYGWSPARRVVSVNGQPLSILSDLVGKFDTVLLTAADESLIKGKPDLRRRYLDIQLSQGNPRYLHNLKTYLTVLKHRNALLKRGRFQDREMGVWTSRLVECGASLIRERHLAVQRLAAFADHAVRKLSSAGDKLELAYQTLHPGTQLAAIQNHFKQQLEDKSREERLLGYTLSGPHRDDMLITLNGQEARKYASRGQTKTIAIALRFAEADHLKSLKNDWPVFLLDDIVSDLDPERQKALLHLLHPHQQVFIVAPSRDPLRQMIPESHALRLIEIQDGRVRHWEDRPTQERDRK